MFGELLATPGVTEILELRSRLGFLAFHGGALERVTDIVASDAAERSGASYYGILMPDDVDVHLPSKHVDPAQSHLLARFIDHVDVAIAIHGYGRPDRRWSILLGGRNRVLARHVAGYLRSALPHYDVADQLDDVPPELAGQHVDNPVNRPVGAGVQIELPPMVRWNWVHRGWSDDGGAARARQTEALVEALAAAALTWPTPARS